MNFPSLFGPVFTLDKRSLALLRIGTALTLLVDLYDRAKFLSLHYSDSGILPLLDGETLRLATTPRPLLSVYSLAGTPTLVALLFVIAAIFAAGLLIGWRTRLCTIVSWLFLLSLQSRNAFVNQESDTILRLVLLFGIFLPWGECFSRGEKKPPLSFGVRSWATALYVIQLFFIYFSAGVLKTGSLWKNGMAVAQIFQVDALATPFATFLGQHAEICSIATYAVRYFEIFAPLLLLFPGKRNSFTRSLFLGAALFFHLFIALTLRIGLFPLISLVALLGLIPHSFWSKKTELEGFGGSSSILKGKLFTVTELTPLFLLIYVVSVNLGGLGFRNLAPPKPAHLVAKSIGLNQCWTLFGPNPPTPTGGGWYALESTLSDGSQLDLIRQTLFPKEDHRIQKKFLGLRWFKYFEVLARLDSEKFYRDFTIPFCRNWNASHSSTQIANKVSLIYRADAPKERRVLFSTLCPDSTPAKTLSR